MEDRMDEAYMVHLSDDELLHVYNLRKERTETAMRAIVKRVSNMKYVEQQNSYLVHILKRCFKALKYADTPQKEKNEIIQHIETLIKEGEKK